jgi:uncharacterized protein YndB with AHSA1/START domain
MTTPDVPHRFEHSVEVRATPEQVWEAVATGRGMSAWIVVTEMEEHEGGSVVFHMGEISSKGEVTAWDPPRRVVYAEPDWPELAGITDATVTPLLTEILVEAKAGGTCIVRVVSSAFGTGADWENEFFEGMAEGWYPAMEQLRLYLAEFAGQQVTNLFADANLARPASEVRAAMVSAFGVTELGAPVEGRGISGVLVDEGAQHLTFRLTAPMPGFVLLMTNGNDERTMVVAQARLFSPDAAAWVEREQKAWQVWLEGLA